MAELVSHHATLISKDIFFILFHSFIFKKGFIVPNLSYVCIPPLGGFRDHLTHSVASWIFWKTLLWLKNVPLYESCLPKTGARPGFSSLPNSSGTRIHTIQEPETEMWDFATEEWCKEASRAPENPLLRRCGGKVGWLLWVALVKVLAFISKHRFCKQ